MDQSVHSRSGTNEYVYSYGAGMKENTPTNRPEGKAGKPDAKVRTGDKPEWAPPKLEEVSGQVMAQPYIRFT